MKSVESVVLTILGDLNLTYDKLETEPLEENLLDTIKDKARVAANSIRNTKGKISDKVQAVGDAIGTDASIIRSGTLLVKDNEFVGIPEIKPDSQAAKDVMKYYPGYTIATPEQRAFAEQQHIKIAPVDPNAPWNLKTVFNSYLTKAIADLTQAKNTLDGRKLITASEAAAVMNAINSGEKDILTHIEKANLTPTGPVVAASPTKTEEPAAASTPSPSVTPAEAISEPTKGPETPIPAPAPSTVAPEPVVEPVNPTTTVPATVSEPKVPLVGPDGLPSAPPPRNQAEEDMAAYRQGADRLQDPEVKKRLGRASALDDFENVVPDRTSQYESIDYSGLLDIFYN